MSGWEEFFDKAGQVGDDSRICSPLWDDVYKAFFARREAEVREKLTFRVRHLYEISRISWDDFLPPFIKKRIGRRKKEEDHG